MKEHFAEQKSLKDKGFSLVEIVVIVAIMIVLLAILTPSILRYVENSRMQKDDSAMDEVCHGVLLALSDSEIFDEAVSYAIPNNYVTYTDSSGVYAAKYVDEEFWAPDGSGNAVTITFNPDENGTYTLANGLVNDMTYGNGSVADTRVADGVKQCYFSEMGQQKLYHKVAQTIGETFSEKSATYHNSSYTVFITFDVVNGIKRADVYGEWNGTNLDESCPASLGSGTNSYTEDEEPEQTKTGGTTQSNYTSSDLQGGGGTSGNTPSYKQDDLPCGHKPTTPGNHEQLPCDHYACTNCGCAATGVIPDEGSYKTLSGTTYNPGDPFPDVLTTGDIYVYGDYEYRYNQYMGNQWTTNNNQNGWGVICTKNIEQPSPILHSINGKPVVNMYNTFGKTKKLEIAPTIPNTVTNLSFTFSGCAELKTYVGSTAPAGDFSNYNLPSGTTTLCNTFNGCKSIEYAPTIPSSVSDMQSAFVSCSSLKEAPDFANPKSGISMYMSFYKCTSLTDLSHYQLPPNASMAGTFRDCTSLMYAPEIPNTITQLPSTFQGCASLKTVPALHQNIINLREAFRGCTSLSGTITINSTKIQTNVNEYVNTCIRMFSGVDFEQQNITLVGLQDTVLDLCGATGSNYCADCNGKCQNNH